MIKSVSRLLIAAVCLFATVPAWAQIPPGYYVEQITDNDWFEYNPRINNRGQIVFMARLTDDVESEEIFLYDAGKLTRLTNDNVRDAFPYINDDGVMTWSRGIGPMGKYGPTTEVVLYKDGKLTRLTDNNVYDYAESINILGHVVFLRFMSPGCRGVTMDLFFYDGEKIRRLTTDGENLGRANQTATMNDSDQIVWTKFDFCQDPWESEIMLYSDGESTRLSTDEMFQPTYPDINNRRQVIWSNNDLENRRHPIVLWEQGRTRFLTDGRGARFNESLDIAFNLWDIETDAWQQWFYRNGRTWKLTNDPFWNRANSINDAGEIVWVSGPTFESDIRYMRRFPSGDLNCDGSIDLIDVEPFILALINPDDYSKQYPECDPMLGDINADGSVDLLDVEPFITLLLK